MNLDCVVTAQQPKISPHKGAIRQRVAEILHVASASINVKAKTAEGLGPVGRGELIEARCVVLLGRSAGAVTCMILNPEH